MAEETRLLVERAQSGDPEAISELFENYRPRVIRFCLSFARLSEADAHDVTQDTFIRAFRGICGLREGTRFEAWLFSIARRRCLTFIRRNKKRIEDRRRLELEAVQKTKSSPETENMRQAEKEVVAEEIERMPESDMKEAGRLFYLAGENTSAIAEKMGAPASTVTTWLSRFRVRIRKRLVIRILELRGHSEVSK